MIKRWATIKSTTAPDIRPTEDYNISEVTSVTFPSVEDEYNADGSYLGAKANFTVTFNATTFKPCSLVVTLLRKISTEDDSTYNQVASGVFSPNEANVATGSLFDYSPTVGVGYSYKVTISSNTGNLLKHSGTIKTAVDCATVNTLTPGYYDTYVTYPVIINVTKPTNSFNTLRLSWGFPGTVPGYVKPAAGAYPLTTGHTGDYKKLIDSGFTDITSDVLNASKTLLTATGKANYSIYGLIPRYFTAYDTSSLAESLLNTKELLDKNEDIEDWSFEVLRSVNPSAVAPDTLPAGNPDNVIDDTSPDDNASDYNPDTNSDKFVTIYKGKESTIDTLFNNETISAGDIYFSGVLTIKWSNRLAQLAANSTKKVVTGDAPAAGSKFTRFSPVITEAGKVV